MARHNILGTSSYMFRYKFAILGILLKTKSFVLNILPKESALVPKHVGVVPNMKCVL